jgi:hypothetical protein
MEIMGGVAVTGQALVGEGIMAGVGIMVGEVDMATTDTDISHVFMLPRYIFIKQGARSKLPNNSYMPCNIAQIMISQQKTILNARLVRGLIEPL